MKRRLRNQPDRLWKPLRVTLRAVAGVCPSCVFLRESTDQPAVIYRRSEHSITFRCQKCSLQWTVTFVTFHRAVIRQLAIGIKDPQLAAVYELAAEQTKFAADHEATRKSSITRQKKTSVIRLPDRSAP